MAVHAEHVPIDDTELPHLVDSESLGPVDPTTAVVFTLHVRPRQEFTRHESLHAAMPHEQDHLTNEEFEERHGIDPEDLIAIERFAERYGFETLTAQTATGIVELEGTAAACNQAFAIELQTRRDFLGVYRAYSGQLHIPKSLDGIVQGVTGLDNQSSPMRAGPDIHRSCAPVEWKLHWPGEIAAAYRFPQELDGTGQTIGIVSLGGQFRMTDMEQYFDLQRLKTPEIIVVRAGKSPCQAPDSFLDNLEVTTDLQIAGSLAPGAKLVVYSVSPDLPDPYFKAISTAISDRENRPTVLSISYGAAERLYHKSLLLRLNDLLSKAAMHGITICAASGDGGAGTRYCDKFLPPPVTPHVNFPASCPFALAVGGTSLEIDDSGRTASEVVWNNLNLCRMASGGGISTVFPQPAYQVDANLPPNATPGVLFRGRGVPDVAGNADPNTGFRVILGGQTLPGGGTSASTPMWAALIARINQGLEGQRCGHINPLLYRLANTGAFKSITQGFNGCYQAALGWDPCTGLGVPNGDVLFQEIRRLMNQRRADWTPAAPQNFYPIEQSVAIANAAAGWASCSAFAAQRCPRR